MRAEEEQKVKKKKCSLYCSRALQKRINTVGGSLIRFKVDFCLHSFVQKLEKLILGPDVPHSNICVDKAFVV